MQQQPNPSDVDRGGFNLSRWAIQHASLTVYFFVVLILGGAVAYFQLGQDEDPPFTFRAMVIRAQWPGATATQMSEQVADKIEKTLQQVPYADKIATYSKPGETTIIFQLKDSSPPRDVQGVWYQVRKKVGDMRYTLPQGVQGPFFNDEFGDVFGVIYALTGDGYSMAELKDYADRVRQQLLKVPNVAKVDEFGVQDEKLNIVVSQKRLSQLGIDLTQVLGSIGQQNDVQATGVIRTPGDDVQVRLSGQFKSPADLALLPVRANGNSFKLGDIATIQRAYADPPQPGVRFDGREVVALGISMAKGGDIIELGKDLAVASRQIQQGLPAGLTLEQIQDQPRAVANSVGEFVRTLFEALLIVLAVSFLSLGLHTRPLRVDIRPGAVVALAIPSVLAVTFLIMYYAGVGLHKISLGSLIIALGLLVDDAIIAVEMMVRKLEEGYDKLRAATFAYEVTAMPMLTGTLITAAGFLPIGLAKSVTGEYTFAIFAVTSAALLVSWVVSVYFVPYLGFRLLKVKPHAAGDQPHELFDTPFYSRFRRTVNWCVAHRWWTIGATVLAFALGMVGMAKVEKQFFPDSSRPELMVELWTPEGSDIHAVSEVSRRVEQRLLKEPGVRSVTTFVGSGAPRFYLPLDQIFPQSNVAQMIVLPADLKVRESLRQRLPALLATEFPEVRGRVKLLPNGPPVPYPVQYRVAGEDAQQVRVIADQVKALMRANPNTRGVNDNWNESIKVLRLSVDQDKARALGISNQAIAQAAQTILSGSTVGQYRDGDKLIDIVLRQPAEERDQLTDLTNAYVPTTLGKPVPLSQVARAHFTWEPGVMWRLNRDYAITVNADVRDGIQGPTVSDQLKPRLNELRARLPAGYRIEVAGAEEESAKGQGSIVAGVPLMLFIIFTLLMLQLRSFPRAMLAYLTGPFGIIGAAATLLLFNRPFGFVALLGMIALMGMIIRNSVILLDQIQRDVALGVDEWTAIVEAAVRRFRPIILTAAAAILAMIPLSRSVFWGPMAVAIMGGLAVATVLTLLSLPAMYAAWFRVKRGTPASS
ncbi:MAG: efflux RND transporter permease subunit [Betaproteobacteria bacterium]|nr:efflux RND transporter permease subunit [Betaproteobacteria bacterium]